MPAKITKLTFAEIKNAKPAEKDYSLFDGDGLLLYVKKLGQKFGVFVTAAQPLESARQ